MKYLIMVYALGAGLLNGNIKDKTLEFARSSDLIIRMTYKQGQELPHKVVYLRVNKKAANIMDSLNSIDYTRHDLENELVIIKIIRTNKHDREDWSITEKEGSMRLIDAQTKERVWVNTRDFLKSIDPK